MSDKVLEVKNLVTEFFVGKGRVTAVNDVSFDVFKGFSVTSKLSFVAI